MEPDVIRLYSSSPPPLEDSGVVEEDDDFRDFTEFETPTTFNHVQALNATSPPEMISNGRIVGILPPAISNGSVGVTELKKVTEPPLGGFTNISENSRTDCVDCNGAGGRDGALTNGFAPFGKESPFSSHRHRERDPDAILSDRNQDFANFAAFPDADLPSHVDSGANWDDFIVEQDSQSHCEESISNTAVDNDQDVTGFSSFAGAPEGLSNGDWGLHNNTRQRNQESDELQNSNPADSPGTETPPAQNGVALEGSEGVDKQVNRVSPISVEDRGSSSEPTEEKGSENDTETETETETSFGRPLSTEALEEFGDFSTTGSVPSPPLQEDTATPADHSQLVEDDEDFGDFGDFGEANSFSGVGFADFDQQEAVTQVEAKDSETACAEEEEEFGDFDTHGTSSTVVREEKGSSFASFPGSDSFADFTSAPADGCAKGNDGWQAFSEPDSNEEMGESWAAFGQNQGSVFSEMTDNNWHEGQSPTVTTPPKDNSDNCSLTASLLSCLEKLFSSSFPEPSTSLLEEDVPPLKYFLQPMDRSERRGKDAAADDVPLQDVWQLLQDIHNALGLRHQWGGSHCNKALLCSLGIDTRNILFTGQKKQPVIVPMFAASLGMLEPTKEPVKPVSAAEMIASIAQSPPVVTEISPCPSDSAQESLPPVQFDWSSSGLTNPLDGVDPELYELTQAKLEVSSGGNKVADAFARLMSTVEKTNTSTRRVQVQKEENLSEEARRVISTLPDLSFMQAKVLMFPSTLTPLAPSSSSSSSVPD